MKKIKSIFNQEHKGIGGLYFLITNIICAVIMVIALQLSWDSQAVAMADNLAHIVSINTTVHCYTSNAPAFKEEIKKPDSSILTKYGVNYSPLDDFNKMIKQSGISSTGASECEVTWTGNRAYVQMGPFKTSLGTKVRPHQQESVIEND